MTIEKIKLSTSQKAIIRTKSFYALSYAQYPLTFNTHVILKQD